MRVYYLIPESTAERVLTGIKPKRANPASPGVNGQSCLNPQPSDDYHTTGAIELYYIHSINNSFIGRGC